MEYTDIIKKGVPPWVKEARKYTKTLNVHINGIGVAEHLDHIERYENDVQLNLRHKFATSNKFVFANLLRPVDKIFNADGGSKIINTKTETSLKLVNSKLNNLVDGYSSKDYISKLQFNKYYSDPSGVVFFEWKDGETWPTFKSINVIRNYETDGRNIKWILFEPEKRIDSTGKEIEGDFYRFVDSEKDYLLHVVKEQIKEIEEETFENPWGYVPSFTNSDILNSELTYHISPVDSVIELADHYLRTTSVKNIYEFLHGYPIFWAYVQKCKVCDGTGNYDSGICPTCNGDGHSFKKDVSDIIKLKPPENNEDPTIAPDVAGYVQPDLATWGEQRTELDWLWGLMHFTEWGTARQEKAGNETATAAFIDAQPVNDRLNTYADAYEGTEELIIDIVGLFYARENYEGASVNSGRRFLVETPDVVWGKYQKARETKAPKISLDYLLLQFFQSEFKNDIENLVVYKKGLILEPFIHKTDEEIQSLPVGDEDKKKKFYFSEWWKTLKTEEILRTDTYKLDEKLNEFIKTKIINEKTEEYGTDV